ncbi:MAG: hypothetical protein ACUZ8I_14965 [Candidatus Scalindua sp.]
MILAIDPGTTQSGWVVYEDGRIVDKCITENNILIRRIDGKYNHFGRCNKLYIEMMASLGMPVGKTVLETCVWIGRIIEAWGHEWEYVYRKDVKMYLCGNIKAKDSNIRQAIMDLYGSERSVAIGTKKAPGPLYGMKYDEWAALAVAITAEHNR